ncbi:MAG: HAMP domain-containing sensor histidine kinase [Umezawaea sp.]
MNSPASAESPWWLRGWRYFRPPALYSRLRRQSILMLVITLGALNVAAYFEQRSLIYGQVEQTLRQASDYVKEEAVSRAGAPYANLHVFAPSDLYVAVLGEGETVLSQRRAVSTDDVPAVADLLDRDELGLDRITPATAPGGTDYSMLVVALDATALLPDKTAPIRVTAVVIGHPLTSRQKAMRTLLIAEAGFGLTVLAGWILLSRRFIRGALRPLDDIARTSAAIAEGNTGERLHVAEGDPDLSRVAQVLNEAFDSRQRGEDKMRDFVADASHELRTPLASVRGWADLYLEGGLRDREGVDTAMQTIHAEADRMQDLVEQMLALARLDAQPRSDALEAVPIAALAEEVMASVRALHPGHDFVLARIDPATAVLAEPASLRRVISNLLVNAGRHTPPGTTMTVSAQLLDVTGVSWWEVRVDDDGPGLSEMERAHAFDRFWRSDRSRSRPGGSGLGLSICQAVLRGAGGDLRLERSPQGGLAAICLLRPASPDTSDHATAR